MNQSDSKPESQTEQSSQRVKNGQRHPLLILFCKLDHFEIFTKNRDLAGRAGRSKNGRSHFKLILCCFWAIISPHTKFHPNRMKNTEVENFCYWSVLVGREDLTYHSKTAGVWTIFIVQH